MEKTIEQLYFDIGTELSQMEESGFPENPLQLVERGKKWFNNKRTEFQKLVCLNVNLKTYASSDSEKTTLILAIADLIASLCINVSPITVAHLIVKAGLRSFCQVYWEKLK